LHYHLGDLFNSAQLQGPAQCIRIYNKIRLSTQRTITTSRRTPIRFKWESQ
jgi:hypothetical protein